MKLFALFVISASLGFAAFNLTKNEMHITIPQIEIIIHKPQNLRGQRSE